MNDPVCEALFYFWPYVQPLTAPHLSQLSGADMARPYHTSPWSFLCFSLLSASIPSAVPNGIWFLLRLLAPGGPICIKCQTIGESRRSCLASLPLSLQVNPQFFPSRVWMLALSPRQGRLPELQFLPRWRLPLAFALHHLRPLSPVL